MTEREFFENHTALEVRKNPDLLGFFNELFKKKYNKSTGCVPCSVTSYFEKMKNDYFNKNKLKHNNIMENDFKLRELSNDILTYKNEKGRKVRMRDTLLTAEFVEGFLTYGSKEVIEERKKLFKLLPIKFREPKKDKETPKEKSKDELINEYFELTGEKLSRNMKVENILAKLSNLDK